MLAARIDGKKVVTLEGMQREAQEFGSFLANEGAEQCGFCNPGFIMNVFAMLNELKEPTEEQIKEYLAGNLCRCSRICFSDGEYFEISEIQKSTGGGIK